MRLNSLKKIVIGFLIFSQLSFWPALVFAQTVPLGAFNPVPTDNTGSVAANAAFNLAIKPIQLALTTCNSVLQTFESTDNATQVGFSFSSIIGGGGALAQAYLNEVGAYSTYLNCLQGGPAVSLAVLPALNAVIAPNLITSNLLEQMKSQVKAKIQTYEPKLKTALERYDNASQNIWKALLITILINTTKTVADQLVNRLVNNYKIANLKAYTDSVATLAYDNQFIRQNFPDAQSQLMGRAILTNPLFRSQIQPGIYVQANNALPYSSGTINVNDPNFYANMAMAGSSRANPYYLQTSYVAGVDQSRAGSLATAQSHIAQGNGYKAPVTNCASAVVQQKSLDLQNKALSDQLANRQALYNNLRNGVEAGQNVSQADLNKAEADLNAATAAWNNAPDGLDKGNPALIMCEAVASPAVLVNQGIDALFKSVSNNISQYNSNNLPGYLSVISGIATQIGSSMVLGGITGSGTVNENQALGQAISATAAAGIQTLNNNQAANMAKGVILNFDLNNGVPNSFTLSWQIIDTQVTGASYVTLAGDGLIATTSVDPKTKAVVLNKFPLTGSNALTTTKGGVYTVTVYDATGKVLTSATATLTPNPAPASAVPAGGSGNLVCNGSYPTVAACVAQNGQDYCNTLCGTVAGAYTSSPDIQTRGPQADLFIR